MELSVLERLVALSILPKEGDFTTLKIVRKLRESFSFSEEEHQKLQFKQEGEKLTWNQDAEFLKDVHMGEKAKDIIKNALKKLNEDKKLQEEHFTLYEKFIEKDKD